MEFKIGDRVTTKSFENVSEETRNSAMAKVTGKDGTIIDKLYSEAKGAYIYKVHIDGYTRASSVCWKAEDLELMPEKVSYRFDIDITDTVHNVVIVRMLKKVGDLEMQVAMGHGHVIHEGDLGIAQAASYALARIYKSLEGKKNGK